MRVEIGPNDVKRRSAVVALAGEAGTVAKKKTVMMGKSMVKHIRRLLTGMGIECVNKARGKKEEDGKKQEEEKDNEEDDDDEEEEEKEEEKEEGGERNGVEVPLGGGDDMDEFDLEVADPEEEALTMTRVDIAKKKRKLEKEKKREEKRAGREKDDERGGAQGADKSTEKSEKKVKARVVRF